MPIFFCPIDSNLLHVSNEARTEEEEERYTRRGQRLYHWYCLTCSFTYPINEAVRIEVVLNPKEVDDVVGGEGAWKYAAVEKKVHCEREGCTNKGAYFREVQTRSADEAATLYFRCTSCRYQWVHRG